MNDLIKLKNLLYDIIQVPTEDNDTDLQRIQQGMNVAVSNAVRKNGNIIVIQNANIYNNKIIHNVVAGLKLLDNIIDSKPIIAESQKLIELPEPPNNNELDLIKEVCELFYSMGMGLNEVLDIVKLKYIKFVVDSSEGNKTNAAKKLQIQRTSLSRLLSSKEKDHEESYN
jgi:DNA-binding NtrC family response regulator